MEDLQTEKLSEEIHHKTVRKKIGIWMDHSVANLIVFTNNPTETLTIESTFTHEVMEESLNKSENVMHNKEQLQMTKYYKKLGDIIKDYDEVLLFGPTNAKNELSNILKTDHHFDKINIDIKSADKMSNNEQHAFVREYFS